MPPLSAQGRGRAPEQEVEEEVEEATLVVPQNLGPRWRDLADQAQPSAGASGLEPDEL